MGFLEGTFKKGAGLPDGGTSGNADQLPDSFNGDVDFPYPDAFIGDHDISYPDEADVGIFDDATSKPQQSRLTFTGTAIATDGTAGIKESTKFTHTGSTGVQVITPSVAEQNTTTHTGTSGSDSTSSAGVVEKIDITATQFLADGVTPRLSGAIAIPTADVISVLLDDFPEPFTLEVNQRANMNVVNADQGLTDGDVGFTSHANAVFGIVAVGEDSSVIGEYHQNFGLAVAAGSYTRSDLADAIVGGVNKTLTIGNATPMNATAVKVSDTEVTITMDSNEGDTIAKNYARPPNSPGVAVIDLSDYTFIQPGAPIGTLDRLTLRLDEFHKVPRGSSGTLFDAVVLDITGSSNFSSVAQQLENAVQAEIDAGNLQDFTVTREIGKVNLDTTVIGDRENAAFVLVGGTGSTTLLTLNVEQVGSDAVVAVRDTIQYSNIDTTNGHTLSEVGTALVNTTTGVSVDNQLLALVSQIGGYTGDTSTVGSFVFTSDNAGAEGDIVFAHTAGTGSTLVISNAVTRQGSNTVVTGTLSTVRFVIQGEIFTVTYPSGSSATEQSPFAKSVIDATATGFTTSVSGADLTTIANAVSSHTDATTTLLVEGTPTSGTYTKPSVTILAQGTDGAFYRITITGGGIDTSVVYDGVGETVVELIASLSTAINTNTGSSTYLTTGSLLEFRSILEDRYPDAAITIEDATGDVTITASTVILGR